MSKNDVYIVGAGLVPVGEYWEKSLRAMALEAIHQAREEAGGIAPRAMYVANMLAPALSRQSHLGALLADFAGLRGIEALSVEAAGASGGLALRQAYLAVASGEIESALVVGVEKITERISSEIESALSTASDADFEAVHGVTQTSLAALLMRRYMFEFAVPEHGFEGFSVNAHANGVSSPHAMFRRAIKAETYRKAVMVSDPINMFDAAPLGDGAAALILTNGENLPDGIQAPSIRISGSASSVHALSLHDRPDTLELAAAKQSAHQALEGAGITIQEVDFFELHDLFSIYAALSLEAAGFAQRGEGWKLAQNGSISTEGDCPICTYGGSKARGDAGGATGVYQAVEAVYQLQGRAGENQVTNARIGMVMCLGGTGGTAATHILSRADIE